MPSWHDRHPRLFSSACACVCRISGEIRGVAAAGPLAVWEANSAAAIATAMSTTKNIFFIYPSRSELQNDVGEHVIQRIVAS